MRRSAKEAMGFGDVKFVGAIGAFCGWHGAVFSVFGGALLGTIWLGLAFAWRSLSRGKRAGPPVRQPRALRADARRGRRPVLPPLPLPGRRLVRRAGDAAF